MSLRDRGNRRLELRRVILFRQNSAAQTLCHPRLRFLVLWLWSSVRLMLATHLSNREVRAVAAGANWFQPALTSSLRQALLRRRNGALAQNCATLTEREIQVLRLMAGGLTNRQIAQSLQTAEGTVKNQVSSILAKMVVPDRTLAVLTAIDAGMV
jgi:DNA-binding CsgD family transcriptional regulator